MSDNKDSNMFNDELEHAYPDFMPRQIRATIRRFAKPDTLFVVRLFDPAEEYQFRYEDREKIIRLLKVNAYRNAFFAINPAKLDVTNKYINDADIACISKLYFDSDTVRKASTASTKAQQNASRQLIDNLWIFFENHVPGFTKSALIADSGNGYHLHVDLTGYPNTQLYKDRIKSLLKAVDKMFSNSQVKIDPIVSNPSRICRFYGLLNRKGNRTDHMAMWDDTATDTEPINLLDGEIWKTLMQVLDINVIPNEWMDDQRTSVKHAHTQPAWFWNDVVEGSRNNTAFQRARCLVNPSEAGYKAEDAWHILQEWNRLCCKPSLDEQELGRIFQSALKGGDKPEYALSANEAPRAIAKKCAEFLLNYLNAVPDKSDQDSEGTHE